MVQVRYFIFLWEKAFCCIFIYQNYATECITDNNPCLRQDINMLFPCSLTLPSISSFVFSNKTLLCFQLIVFLWWKNLILNWFVYFYPFWILVINKFELILFPEKFLAISIPCRVSCNSEEEEEEAAHHWMGIAGRLFERFFLILLGALWVINLL